MIGNFARSLALKGEQDVSTRMRIMDIGFIRLIVQYSPFSADIKLHVHRAPNGSFTPKLVLKGFYSRCFCSGLPRDHLS
jgi:hypothetical protein